MKKTKDSITSLDIILLSLALLFTIFVIRAKLFNLVDKDIIGKDIMFLTLSIWFTLFIFQFVALRKTIVFLCWSIISMVLFGMFLWLRNDSSLNYLAKSGEAHNYAHGLISPFLVLLLFQICRQLSLKFYKVELGRPSRVTNYIPEQKRAATWYDKICAIGFICAPIAAFYF